MLCTEKFPSLIIYVIPLKTFSLIILLKLISYTREDKLFWYGNTSSLSFAYIHFTASSNALLHNIVQDTFATAMLFSASTDASANVLNISFFSIKSKLDISPPIINYIIYLFHHL